MHVVQKQQQKKSKKQKFWYNIFQDRHDLVGAFCDEELLGKTIKNDKISFKISKNFYGGKLVDEDVILKIMSMISIGNIIGKKIVKFAINNGFITTENIILINEIPHAQFTKVKI